MRGAMLDSEFYCCKCGNKGLPVLRKKGQERETGHLKKLWCLHCHETINHAECKPYSKYTYTEFLLEFNYHNFDENQNRIQPFGIFKDKLLKQGVDIYGKEKIVNNVRSAGEWQEYMDPES